MLICLLLAILLVIKRLVVFFAGNWIYYLVCFGCKLRKCKCFIMVPFEQDLQKYSGTFQSPGHYWVAHKWLTHTCSYSSVIKHCKFLPVASLLCKCNFLRLMLWMVQFLIFLGGSLMYNITQAYLHWSFNVIFILLCHSGQ